MKQLLLVAAACLLAPGLAAAGDVVIHAGRLIDGVSAAPRGEVSILIHDDRVTAVEAGYVTPAGATVIEANVIADNSLSGGNGGGISLFAAGSPVIRNNVIARNSVSGLSPAAQGGGIWIVNQSDALIVQNVIVENSAGEGGGVYWLLPSGARGPRLVNNTIADNLPRRSLACR